MPKKKPKAPEPEDPRVTDTWFVVQIYDPETREWEDRLDFDFTRGEARREMCLVNCYGYKARIIERIASFRIIAEKDFREKEG